MLNNDLSSIMTREFPSFYRADISNPEVYGI